MIGYVPIALQYCLRRGEMLRLIFCGLEDNSWKEMKKVNLQKVLEYMI